jgi:hypothetical protein
MDDTFVLMNRIEAVLWLVIASTVALGCSYTGRWSVWRGMGVVVLIAFGVSDIVETTTGAWWRPWWLFAWKTICVVWFAAWTRVEWKRKS